MVGLRRLAGLFTKGTAPAWMPADGIYPALASFSATSLAGQSGAMVLWHLGVRPRWLYAGGVHDLGKAIAGAQAVPALVAAAVHGGVYLAWTPAAAADLPMIAASLIAQTAPVEPALLLPTAVAPAAADHVVRFPLPPGTRDIV